MENGIEAYLKPIEKTGRFVGVIGFRVPLIPIHFRMSGLNLMQIIQASATEINELCLANVCASNYYA